MFGLTFKSLVNFHVWCKIKVCQCLGSLSLCLASNSTYPGVAAKVPPSMHPESSILGPVPAEERVWPLIK